MRRIGFATSDTHHSRFAVTRSKCLGHDVCIAASTSHASADANLVQDIACRRLTCGLTVVTTSPAADMRCGPYGCGWRAVCWDDPYSHPGTYYHGYDGPFDYGYGGFYNYYGGVPLRWSRPYRPYGQ